MLQDSLSKKYWNAKFLSSVFSRREIYRPEITLYLDIFIQWWRGKTGPNFFTVEIL